MSAGERQDIRGQALKFILVGVVSAGTHYSVYLSLIVALSIGAVPATVVGFILGTIVSYVLNSRYTFQAAQTPATFARFWLVTLAGGALNAGVVWVLVGAGMHFAIAGVIAICVAAAFNFLCHRYWTFAERRPLEEPYQA